MPISEKVVAEVVGEASKKMNDPRYAQTLVGSWVASQPDAARYMSASARELGGAEGVVNAVFHCALIAQCFYKHFGRSVRAMTFRELDHVADGDRDATLRKKQPAIADYIAANIEHAEMKKTVTLMALGMDLVS
jgi:hypothetical protein